MKTVEEKLKEKSDDAGLFKTYLRVLPLDDALQICLQALEMQRESCLKNADIGFEETTGGYFAYINRLSVLNAPQPKFKE